MHKISAGVLIVISAILLGLSISGIVMIWMWKEPLAQVSTSRLQTVDRDLAQAQYALQNAEFELERKCAGTFQWSGSIRSDWT